MFASFGEITFEILSGPGSIDEELRWEYAEHRVVEDLPKLQWIADGLETLTMEMFFHRAFSNPAAQLEALILAASDHQARALVFANGDLRGYFVITSLKTSFRQLSDLGDPVAIAVHVSLKKWDFASETNRGLNLRGINPIAAVAAPPGTSTGLASLDGGAGVSADIAPLLQGYSGPTLPAAGVSLLVAVLSQTKTTGPFPIPVPDDVPPSLIVRTDHSHE
jgi:phage protein U